MIAEQTLTDKMFELTAYAEAKLKEHGLASKGWTFGWQNYRRAFGTCHYSIKMIKLSLPMLKSGESVEAMKGTIMHEVAHAIAGDKAGHGPVWKAAMIQLGQKPNRCRPSDGAKPDFKWRLSCESCDFSQGYFRKPATAAYGSCPVCDNKYNPEFILKLERLR